MFDGHVLDMIELGLSVVGAQSMAEVEGPKKLLGAKPLFLFQGDEWDRHTTLGKLKNLLLDCFGSKAQGKISLPAIDHVVSVTAVPGGSGSTEGTGAGWAGTICWRVYTVLLKRSGTLVPRVELLPHGPSMDWSIRRTHFAASDLEREAMRIPAQLKVKKTKNVSHDEFGETLGRIHMVRQDFTGLHLRKTRATKAEIRQGKKARKEEGAQEEEGEQEEGEGQDGMEEEEVAAPSAGAAKAGKKRSR